MASRKHPVRFCRWCGKQLLSGHRAYCNNLCKGNDYRRTAGLVGGGPVAPTPYVPRPKKILISDEQQREIDRAVAAKNSLQLSSRVIRPGDPDFEAVAAQCTPVELIPDRYFADVQCTNLYGLSRA
jgi:hypothetical protein